MTSIHCSLRFPPSRSMQNYPRVSTLLASKCYEYHQVMQFHDSVTHRRSISSFNLAHDSIRQHRPDPTPLSLSRLHESRTNQQLLHERWQSIADRWNASRFVMASVHEFGSSTSVDRSLRSVLDSTQAGQLHTLRMQMNKLKDQWLSAAWLCLRTAAKHGAVSCVTTCEPLSMALSLLLIGDLQLFLPCSEVWHCPSQSVKYQFWTSLVSQHIHQGLDPIIVCSSDEDVQGARNVAAALATSGQVQVWHVKSAQDLDRLRTLLESS